MDRMRDEGSSEPRIWARYGQGVVRRVGRPRRQKAGRKADILLLVSQNRWRADGMFPTFPNRSSQQAHSVQRRYRGGCQNESAGGGVGGGGLLAGDGEVEIRNWAGRRASSRLTSVSARLNICRSAADAAPRLGWPLGRRRKRPLRKGGSTSRRTNVPTGERTSEEYGWRQRGR